MNDASGAYDRMIEKILADHGIDIGKLEDRVMKLELWRNTTLTIFVVLVFLAGASARDLVAFFKHLGG